MTPPDTYMDLVIVPQVVGVDPLRFVTEYPPALKEMIRMLVGQHLIAGWGGKPEIARHA